MSKASPILGGRRDVSVAWLATAYDRFSPPAYTLAMRLLGEAPAAQDVLVQSFAHLARHRHECTAAQVPAAVMALTRHFAIREVRRRLGLPLTVDAPPVLATAALTAELPSGSTARSEATSGLSLTPWPSTRATVQEG